MVSQDILCSRSTVLKNVRGSAPPVGLPGWPLVNWRVEEPKGGKFVASAFPSYPNRRGVICHQSGTDSKGMAALYVTHPALETPLSKTQ